MINKITKLDHLSKDDFKNTFLANSMPVIIRNLTNKWKANTDWNGDYFKKNYGHLIATVRDYKVKPYIDTKMRIADYIEYWNNLSESDIRPEPNLYLTDWNFTQSAPQLSNDFETPDLFEDDWISRLPRNLQYGREWVFIGHKGVSTPLHTDTFSSSAWISMIQGSKGLRLVPPEYGTFMYKGINLYDEQVTKALKTKNVPVFDATIEKGDTIFIPGRWYHQVINLNKNIMLTKNFVDDHNFLYFEQEFREKILKPLTALTDAKEKFITETFKPQTHSVSSDYIKKEIDHIKHTKFRLQFMESFLTQLKHHE